MLEELKIGNHASYARLDNFKSHADYRNFIFCTLELSKKFSDTEAPEPAHLATDKSRFLQITTERRSN